MNLFNGDKKPEFTGGTQLLNYIFPRILHQHAPGIYYWTGSPYGGELPPAEDERGDQHKWILLDFSSENTVNRISPEYYDGVNCKFVSEFGYFGPPKRSEVERYCGGCSEVGSEIWKNHTNTFECGVTNQAIHKHYCDPQGLPLNDFLLYGRLFQGMALEYALGNLRRLEHNSGSLVWCLNDNFGEIGFSVMDRSGNAKISYYFVKRAFAPICLLLRRDVDKVGVWCTSDMAESISFHVECGYTSFDGIKAGTISVAANIEAFCKATLIATLPANEFDLLNGLLYASPSKPGVDSAIFRAHDFRRLRIPRRACLPAALVGKILARFLLQQPELDSQQASSPVSGWPEACLRADPVFAAWRCISILTNEIDRDKIKGNFF